MNITKIAKILPVDRAELEQRWSQWRRTGGDDLAGFLGELHRAGAISAAQVRDVLATAEVEVTERSELPSGSAEDRHRVLGFLGRGAMGEVLLAQDRQLQRPVAIKRMLPHQKESRTGMARFFSEVQITAQLDHQGIIPVYGFETPKSKDDPPAYAMKLVRGRTLDDLLNETKKLYDKGLPIDEEHALPARLDVFLQVCAAVHYAHSRGVLHRDLKPENIMMGPFGEVTVMDWGCARIVGNPETVGGDGDLVVEDRASVTRFGTAVGTPAYMSPEQAMGHNDDLDARSDQCMLGLILFEIVSLKWAITGKTGAEVLTRAARGSRDPFVHYSKKESVSPDLAAIVAKSTAPDPSQRYKTVKDVADDVRRYLRDEPVLANPDGIGKKATRWVSRHRELTLVAVLLLALTVVLSFATTVLGGVILLEIDRRAAEHREARLSHVISAVSAQAHHVDTVFQGYSGLLTGLEFSAEQALHRDPRDDVHGYRSQDYEGPDAPDDIAASSIYKRRISTQHADIWTTPGADPALAGRDFAQLAGLETDLARVLLLSDGVDTLQLAPEARRRKIGASGVPVVWTYVATDHGLIISFPGARGTIEDDYDPRTMTWYAAGYGQRVPQWTPATYDEDGMGLLVSCVVGLFDEAGAPIGVAALDVSLDHILDTLIAPPVDADVESYLVDRSGRTIVHTSMPRDGTLNELPPYPRGEILTAIRQTPAGHAFTDDDKLVVWTPLDAIGWTYIVEGDADELLE